LANYLQELRRRRAELGLKRVELAVSAADADLLKRVAKALARDDQRAQHLRQALLGAVPRGPVKFKDWLQAPSDDQGG
jgi:hypothetical protein